MKCVAILILAVVVAIISYVVIDCVSSMVTQATIYKTHVTGLHHYHQDGFLMFDANNNVIIIPDSDSYCITLEGHSSYCSNYEEITSFNIGDNVEIKSSMSIFGNEHVRSIQKITSNQK